MRARQNQIVVQVEALFWRWCDPQAARLRQTCALGALLLATTLHHLAA
jgi:hypothetical protein